MEEAIAEIDPAILVLVSAFLPLLVSVIVQTNWSTGITALVSLVVTCLVGVAAAFLMGVETRDGYVTTTAAVYVLSQASFFGVMKPTGASPAVEKSTNISSSGGDST